MSDSEFLKWWDSVKDIPAIYKYEHAEAAWNKCRIMQIQKDAAIADKIGFAAHSRTDTQNACSEIAIEIESQLLKEF